MTSSDRLTLIPINYYFLIIFTKLNSVFFANTQISGLFFFNIFDDFLIMRLGVLVFFFSCRSHLFFLLRCTVNTFVFYFILLQVDGFVSIWRFTIKVILLLIIKWVNNPFGALVALDPFSIILNLLLAIWIHLIAIIAIIPFHISGIALNAEKHFAFEISYFMNPL